MQVAGTLLQEGQVGEKEPAASHAAADFTEAALETKAPVEAKADLEKEIEVHTDWASLLDPTPPEPELQQIGEHEVWLLQLFSDDECTRLLRAAEGHGFGKTSYAKKYRGNLRLLATDPSLAEAVWARLQGLVPPELKLAAWDEDVWDACGLNQNWRLAKYHPGDRFQGHCDGAHVRAPNVEMSMLTVNVYMNDVLDGGSTRFYFKDRSVADFAATPKAGLCLLFRQPPGKRYWHDGEQLGSGLKYLFRSDVMYRKRED